MSRDPSLGVTSVLAALDAGEVSSSELVETYLARIEALDGELRRKPRCHRGDRQTRPDHRLQNYGRTILSWVLK